MFQSNEANNNALREYSAQVAAAAREGRISTTDIPEPILATTSPHNADTNDGRVREENGKIQLVESVACVPVWPQQTPRLVASLQKAASQILEIVQLEKERPGRLETFLSKHPVKDFLELGFDIIVALWLHWNHTQLHDFMTHEYHADAVSAIETAIATMLKLLRDAVKNRPGFLEKPQQKMFAFKSDMRRAAYDSFDSHVLMIPRFLHLDTQYEIHKLNLPDFNNIRVVDDDGKLQKAALASGPLTAPAVGTVPFDPSSYKHNISVGYASNQKITSMSPLQYEMSQPISSPTNQYHAPTNQYHAPTNQSQSVQPMYHPPPQHMSPPQPTQPIQHMYNTGQPMQPARPLPGNYSPLSPPIVTFPDLPPSRPAFPLNSPYAELNVPYDKFMADIMRKSEENRARAVAAPIPTIFYDADAGRYRSVTPEIRTRRHDHETSHLNRRAVSHEHLSTHFDSLRVDDTPRASRRRSERLSPHDVPAAHEGAHGIAEGRSRRSSSSKLKSARSPSRCNTDDTEDEESEDGRRRSKQKGSETRRSKSRQSYVSDYDEEVSTKKKSSRSKSRSRVRIQTPESEVEAERVARKKEKRKSSRSEGSKYYA